MVVLEDFFFMMQRHQLNGVKDCAAMVSISVTVMSVSCDCLCVVRLGSVVCEECVVNMCRQSPI